MGKNLFPAPDAAAQSPAAMLRQYGGTCRFEARNGMFYASVLCPAAAEKPPV